MERSLIHAVAVALVGTVALAALCLALYRMRRTVALRIWSLAWGLYALRFVFDLLGAAGGRTAVLLLASQSMALASGMVMLHGTYHFVGRRPSRGWDALAGLAGVWLLAGTVLSGGDLPTVSLPVFLFLGVVFMRTGYAWFAEHSPAGSSSRFAGVVFIVWGLHEIGFPFFADSAGSAPWGYASGAAFEIAIALAVLVTYFRSTVRELEESERRYGKLFSDGLTAVLIVDPATGGVAEANAAAAALYGYPREVLRTMRLSELNGLPPHQVVQDLQSVPASGPRTMVVTHWRSDGRPIQVRVQTGPFELSGRTLAYAMLEDVTQRVREEEALKASEERYSSLFENTHSAMLLVDPFVGDIVDVNAAAAAYYGRSRGELCGAPVDSLSAVTVGGRSGASWFGRTVSGAVYPDRHVTAEGVREVEVRAGPLRVGERELVFAIVHDVTDRRRAEDDLARHRRELEERVRERTVELEAANRDLEKATQAKSEFLAAMSHELRTPLNSVIGFTGVLLQGLAGELTDEQRRQLDMVYGSGMHLLELVNGVLDLAKIEAGRMEAEAQQFDLNEAVSTVLETLRPSAEERGLALDFEPCGCGTQVHTDRTKFQQVLMNLVGNAIKFTEAGWVRVALDCSQIPDLQVHVTDTGVGIAEDDTPHIFDEFKQGSTDGGERPAGTGLGLSVSLKLARLLGGDISVRSAPGEGSEFTLRIPVLLNREVTAGDERRSDSVPRAVV